MTAPIQPLSQQKIFYPESDDQPMADNTKQFRYIVTIQGGLDSLFKDNPDVFVACDLLWYPVEGNNTIRQAPDVMVVFGRPKGDRGSYQQWRENNIAPQVVFEVLSPGNRFGKMLNKFRFYERYGVEEYYVYDPDNGNLEGWLRAGTELNEIDLMEGWVSPRLGIRFAVIENKLQLYRPDGQKFASYVEIDRQRELAEQRAIQEAQRAERLAERLRSLGINPDDV
ncbi:Uma2 family endonuclease [Phormidium sp. LEGE 05292]|uniref:Uma2 family endonuclease n=1 Tax=[Phormidium] sp. LEGE 05292 TaxID=767427 RepID=UPI00187F5FCA|nr:Uma2 family endonuclease [Phormidium sp. LEGE 05292]MBE9224699.1 Uma2 family endonuclease [Phormidium sp. LEGE 05292]